MAADAAAAAKAPEASPAQARKLFDPDSISAVLRRMAAEAARVGDPAPEEGSPARLAAAAGDLDSLLQEEPIRELLLELQHSAQSLTGLDLQKPHHIVELAEQSASSTLQVSLIAPASIAACCLLLSLPLLALEGWTLPVSFNYLVAATCGINPVGEAQNVTPGSFVGALLLGIASAWSLGFAGYLMGQIAELRPFQSYLSFLTRLRQPGDFNHVRVMLLQVFALSPAIVFFAAALLGGILALAEGWTFGDGFLYILGDTTGQANPLVGASPTTLVGMHITSICAMLGYVVCSTIIGLASNLVLPGMGRALREFLGRSCCLPGHSKVLPGMGRALREFLGRSYCLPGHSKVLPAS